MRSIPLNRLETTSIYMLLLEYSIPAIIGSLVVAIYNLVDSVYIANGPSLGEHALGGLGLVLPIMTLITSLALLIGTGASSRISICLGMDNRSLAEDILKQAIILITSFTILIVLGVYVFLEPILILIGATSETYTYAYEFLLYYLPSNIFLNLTFTLCGIIRASGYPNKSMFIMLMGVVLNILIAPIFIFVLEWGMKGAAIATLIATVFTAIPAISHFLTKDSIIKLRLNNFSLDTKVMWAILSIGLAPFIMQLAASVVVFFINNRLRAYGGSCSIEAYTIANRLVLIIILILVGLTQGMQPIIGYNFGAKNIKRVKSTVHLSMIIGVLIGVAGLLIGLFLSDQIIIPFNPTEELAEEIRKALSIIILMLPLSGLQMVISSFMQSIGKPLQATLLSLFRQFIILIPALFIMSWYWGVYGVWASIPISDLLSTLLAVGIYFWQMQQLNKNQI